MSIDASMEQAEDYAATWVAENVQVSGHKPRRKAVAFSGPTFADVAEDWFSGRLAQRYPDHLKTKSSANDDEARLRKYVLPIIGEEPIAAFEGEGGIDLAERVASALPSTLSSGTRRQVLQTVRRVLSVAVYPARLLRAQPLPRGFVPSGKSKRAKTYLFPREEEALQKFTSVPLLERLFYGLLAREGLRVSEALSLTWSDVDLHLGLLHLDVNKTEDARAWALDSGVAEALRRWKLYLGVTLAKPARPILLGKKGETIDPFEAAQNLRRYLKAAGVERPQLFDESEHGSRFARTICARVLLP